MARHTNTRLLGELNQPIKEKPKRENPDWAFSSRILDNDFSNVNFKDSDALFHITNITNGFINILQVINSGSNVEKSTGLGGYTLKLAQNRKKGLTHEKVIAILNTSLEVQRDIRLGYLSKEIALIKLIGEIKDGY